MHRTAQHHQTALHLKPTNAAVNSIGPSGRACQHLIADSVQHASRCLFIHCLLVVAHVSQCSNGLWQTMPLWSGACPRVLTPARITSPHASCETSQSPERPCKTAQPEALVEGCRPVWHVEQCASRPVCLRTSLRQSVSWLNLTHKRLKERCKKAHCTARRQAAGCGWLAPHWLQQLLCMLEVLGVFQRTELARPDIGPEGLEGVMESAVVQAVEHLPVQIAVDCYAAVASSPHRGHNVLHVLHGCARVAHDALVAALQRLQCLLDGGSSILAAGTAGRVRLDRPARTVQA